MNKSQSSSRNALIIIGFSIMLGLSAGHWYALETSSRHFVCTWEVLNRGTPTPLPTPGGRVEGPKYDFRPDFVPNKSTYTSLAMVMETWRMPGLLVGSAIAGLGLWLCSKLFFSGKGSNIFAKIGANILLALGVCFVMGSFEAAELAKAAAIKAGADSPSPNPTYAR